MQSGSQATVDALLEELHAKDEHIKQVRGARVSASVPVPVISAEPC